MAQLRWPVDVLWIVECYPSYQPRGQSISRHLARILNALKIDFAILCPEERCLGDCEWMAGEHGLLEVLIERSIETLRKYRFREIITTDPHGYRTLRNIYPSMGGSFVVKPVVQFLAERFGQVKNLLESKLDAIGTYRDSCCLDRYNGVYDAPRTVLRALGVDLKEMPRNVFLNWPAIRRSLTRRCACRLPLFRPWTWRSSKLCGARYSTAMRPTKPASSPART